MSEPPNHPSERLSALLHHDPSDDAIARWCAALGRGLARDGGAYEDVVEFWFGAPGESWHPRYRGQPDLWFRATPEIDDEVRRRFEARHRDAAAGKLDAWAEHPRGAIALVLLLDQFPRHMFRGQARMFATDERARTFAERALAPGAVEWLSPSQRALAWMCLEHAEDAETVARAVAGLDGLCRDPSTRRARRLYKGLLRSARQHHDLLTRHGRYPHRNELLGRESTAEERAWLAQTRKPRFATSVQSDVAPLRLLVLHSFRQSGARLRSRMKRVERALSSIADFVYADAPHAYAPTDSVRTELAEDFGPDLSDLGDLEHQRCWWNSGADHSHYVGWDASLSYLRELIAERGPFDGVVGFSQGAAVTGLLMASEPSLRFAVCISGFASRAVEHAELVRTAGIDRPSLHVWGEQDVLVTNDRSEALSRCFVDPEVVTHAAGHFVPMHWPVAEIRDFLLAQARPASTCTLDERLRYARKHDRALGLSTATQCLWEGLREGTLAGAELSSAIADALGSGDTTAVAEDLLVIAWALHRDCDLRHAESILAPLPGDEFYRLYLQALRLAPAPFVDWLAMLPRVGGWKVLPRLAVFAAVGPDDELARIVQERIAALFDDRLQREHDGTAPLSDCGVAAPRTESATQRVSGLAAAIATRMAPDCDRRDAYIAYTRRISALSHRWRSAQGPVPSVRAQRRNEALSWEGEVPDDPLSDAVVRPRPVPVQPCPPDQLDPLLEHLRDKTAVDAPTEFPRGTHMPDGRLDLCKQVVGPEGIGPVLDALAGHEHVSHFMIGNNIVGNSGAQAIADFIASGRSYVDVWYIGGNEIDAEGLQPICEALYDNPHVQSLWLKRNPLGPDAGPVLGALVRRNDRLHTLDLVNTGLLDAGAAALIDALPDNQSLRHLYLGTNGLGIDTARRLAAWLAADDRLESLYVSCNRLGDEGAALLADALTRNSTLRRLGLSSNRLGPAAAATLSEALTSNSSLRFLDLGWTRATAAVGELGNRIGDDGAEALAAMLRTNRTLRSLDVSHNRISQAGLDAIATALADNDTLVSLRHPQYGKAVNHDSVDALHARLASNWERFAASDEGRGVTRDDLATPRSTQEILSVYRTA